MSKILANVNVDIELSNISDYDLIVEILKRKDSPMRGHLSKKRVITILDIILGLKFDVTEKNIVIDIQD